MYLMVNCHITSLKFLRLIVRSSCKPSIPHPYQMKLHWRLHVNQSPLLLRASNSAPYKLCSSRMRYILNVKKERLVCKNSRMRGDFNCGLLDYEVVHHGGRLKFKYTCSTQSS